jgi:hypothetical protein
MSDLDSDVVEGAPEAQAVKAKLNPWWIVGALLFAIAVVLGIRSLRSTSSEPPDIAIEEIFVEGEA